MLKTLIYILTFFLCIKSYGQDSLYFSQISIGPAATAAGISINFEMGVRFKKIEPFIGLNHQLLYKNSYPVSKQAFNAPDYPSNFLLGYHGGINYYLKESKVSHVLALRYQRNDFYLWTKIGASDYKYRKYRYHQFSFIYRMGIRAQKQVSIEPFFGPSMLVEYDRFYLPYYYLIFGLNFKLNTLRLK